MNLLDIIFPKSCLGCAQLGKYICQNCITKVGFPTLTCPLCNRPSVDGFTHIKCQKKLGISGLYSVWKYEKVMRKAIVALKYKYATEVGKELTSYIVKKLQSKKFILGNEAVLVPVPLHWYRENYRGFNQSEILGKEIAKAMNWTFMPHLLKKKRWTAHQVGLRREERRKNLQNVFSLSANYSLPTTNYILFDDVYTTGATLKEAARVLKRAGIEKVWGLTLAR